MRNMKYQLLACFCLILNSLHADVRLPNFFSDHMVLQRNSSVKVWGWADRNELVRICFAGRKGQVRADSQGHWMVSLDSVSTGGPYVMEVEGKGNRIFLKDVYVGDVWLCSGQSNMEMPVYGWSSIYDYEEEIRNAVYPLIRAFNVSKGMHAAAQEDVKGAWTVCSPQSVADYSAVAYFFARTLHRELKVPVGIIHSSWGGTEIETWMPSDAYRKLPEHFTERYKGIHIVDFKQFIKENEAKKRWYEAALDEAPGIREQWYLPSADISSWQQMSLPGIWERVLGDLDGIVWYRTSVFLTATEAAGTASLRLGPVDDEDITWINGTKVGETKGYAVKRSYAIPAGVLKEGENVIVVRVVDYSGGGGLYGNPGELLLTTADTSHPLAGEWLYRVAVSNNAFGYVTLSPNMYYGMLYNAMIHPFSHLPLKGVIWYQGESNVGRADEYRTLFPTMIRAWRDAWGTELPFYWVQLANFKAKEENPQSSEWAALREAQSTALSLPRTGQVVAVDIGDGEDIHPRNKQDVGRRLALVALQQTYGWKDVVASGPVFKSMQIKENEVIVSYDHVGGGLMVRNKYGYIEGFAVAGIDRIFHWAQARLEGDKVVISSGKVSHPVAVRYGWSDNPDVNLFNKEGLPAAPFRTDEW